MARTYKKIKKLVLWSVVIGVISLGAFALSVFATDLPDIRNVSERKIAQSTKIYDRTGEILLYDIHGEENRTVIPFEEIPADVKNAAIALEDDSFYSHMGVRPLSTLRAITKNIITGSSEGGSTITQQLVKSVFLNPEKTIFRKIKEMAIALRLEQELTKDEILSLYLNQIPYGSGAYGIQSAAETFFGKKAKDLSLLESTYLASLPNAPSFYSPYGKNKDKLDERAKFTLKRMRDENFISKEKYETALNEQIKFAPPKTQGIIAPHFVLEVREKLNKMFGEDTVESGGFKVTTTLDADLQQKAEEVILKYAEGNQKNFNANNASFVAIDPKSGDTLAMVGSKNYFEKPYPENCSPGVNCSFDPQVNIATRHRQPGSAFKPFVYATAFKNGLTPETVVFDLKTEFNPSCNPDGTPQPGGDEKKCYHPENFDNIFRGPISLRESLAQSLNVPSVKTLYLAGLKNSLSTAKDFGITTLNDPDRYGLTLVLGGGEVSLLELTSAYSVFANDGIKNFHRDILKIEDSKGKIIFEPETAPLQVIDKNISRVISDILSDNKSRAPSFGEFSALYFPGRQVAAKTGTTNDYRDAWVMGYTPSIAMGAWAGNNDNSEMEKRVAGFIVAPMWHEIMEYALSKIPQENFISPDKLIAEKPVLRGEWRGGNEYEIDKISGKLATIYTPEETKEKKVVQEIHSIIYWIKSVEDSQFKNWENVVRDWAQKNGLTDQNENIIPKLYDDIHTPEKLPKITGVEVINLNFLKPQIINYYPISQVDYFIEDEFIGSSKKDPFLINFSQQILEENINQIKVKIKIYDSVKNSTEAIFVIPL